MSDSPQTTTSDLIVDRLRTWGVERVYGYAGDGNNPLLGALRRAGGSPEFISARHEEGAAFMAVGEAKYGERVGVVSSTQGPGAVHLLNGLYDAKLDHAPVVALVAQQHRSALGSGHQQELDLQHLFADVSSPFIQFVAAPEQLPMVLDRAFRSALANSQPSVVILPHDVQQAPAPDLGQSHGEVVTSPRWTTGEVIPRGEDLDAAAEVIAAGEKIGILAGRGVRHAQEELIALAERLGAGVTMSLLGKPYVDESHPLVAGTMGHLGTTASAHVLQECDTLLIIGSDDPWTEFYPVPGTARAIQLDVDPAMIGNRYPVEVGLVGHAAPGIRALLERLPERGDTPWRREVEEQIRIWHEISRLRSEVPARPLNPELVARGLSARVPEDAQLAVDVGSAVYHYVRQMSLPTSVPAHVSSTLASMGCAVPYAVAAKEVAPDRPMVVLAGDGAMEMLGINELITVAERWRGWGNPRFVLLVLHNRDLAEVSWEQRESEAEPRFDASQEVPRFDFAAYAEQLGLHGMRLHDAAALDRVLDEAFTVERPVVIEVLTDPDVPLLPPFPHGRQMLESMRQGLAAEGEAGKHGLQLLNHYAEIEEQRR
ncbi:thiamine pyrophosphate-requiring protein [Corynebacterium halotolerans]|uniref:Thiamine pyrophosphate protein n=1 Tax=Corynebacterium halotolerans YIM 70093 = DSM 44683 TaxID=1121362 RepID=M1NRG6_9CORY|nr:thiamine pyrophosphate-requiring protein [Corynebacterium halotolerans]AGF72097.1 thiamine pyrophosphate protein [Corynebacterium halotolerans YIM 70093 = DSM 44683]